MDSIQRQKTWASSHHQQGLVISFHRLSSESNEASQGRSESYCALGCRELYTHYKIMFREDLPQTATPFTSEIFYWTNCRVWRDVRQAFRCKVPFFRVTWSMTWKGPFVPQILSNISPSYIVGLSRINLAACIFPVPSWLQQHANTTTPFTRLYFSLLRFSIKNTNG